MKLARFRSTAQESQENGWTSLADYVARMKPGQEAIYTISGDDAAALADSPQLEGFRAKGVEVLLLSDPVDDFWVSAVGEYDGKPLKSVTRGAGADLATIEGGESESQDAEGAGSAQAEADTAIAFLKRVLGEQVKDVRRSETLRESPVCLAADAGDMDIHLERLLRQHGQLDRAAPRVLEINPRHALIRHMAARLSAGDGDAGNDDSLKDAALVLFDQAMIQEGELPSDRAGFARRLSALMTKGLSPEPDGDAAKAKPDEAAE